MAKPSQYTFSLEEVAEVLIEKAGLEEGRWQFGIEFLMNLGNIGTSPTESKPGAVLLLNAANLTLANESPEGTPLVFDAAKIRSKKV